MLNTCHLVPVTYSKVATQVTLDILQLAKKLSIPAIWIQPGAEDEAVIEFIKVNNLSDSVIYGGPCILVEGDNIIRHSLL